MRAYENARKNQKHWYCAACKPFQIRCEKIEKTFQRTRKNVEKAKKAAKITSKLPSVLSFWKTFGDGGCMVGLEESVAHAPAHLKLAFQHVNSGGAQPGVQSLSCEAKIYRQAITECEAKCARYIRTIPHASNHD